MAEITVIPLLNAQEQGMASLAATQAARPEAALAANQQNALNTVREQAEQVQKPESSARSDQVSDENGSAGGGASGDRRHDKKRSPDPDAGDLDNSSDPLVGNVLNIKI